MALYHPVQAQPILGIEDGSIVLAATVLGHVTSFGKVSFHVRVWRAGDGERDQYLAPFEFETWRRSFAVPSVAN